jgi:hypothetical protein
MVMKKGAWPTIGGIVAIIVGASFGVTGSLSGIVESTLSQSTEPIITEYIVVGIIWGIPVIIGGVFALRSELWRPFTSGRTETRIGRIGGVLCILSGLLGIPAGMGAIDEGRIGTTVVGAILIALGAVAIVGGVLALIRRNWPLALTGSICSIVSMPPVGIPAHILIVLGRGVFIRE